MSKRFSISITILLLAVSALAQPKLPRARKTTYRISGKVVNAADGQPIPNAEVYLGFPPEPRAREAVLADAEGRFSFAGLSAGKYALLAGKRGFIAASYGARDRYLIGIAVGPGFVDPDLTLQLQAEGTVAGVVLGDGDTPLSDAKINLFRRHLVDGLLHTFLVDDATTDQRGSYRFSHLPPGQYYLAITAKSEFSSSIESAVLVAHGRGSLPPELDVSYPVTYFPGATKATDAQALVLHAGQKLQADLRLHAVPSAHLRLPGDARATFRTQTFDDEDMEGGVMSVPSAVPDSKEYAVAPGAYLVTLEECGNQGCITAVQQLDLTGDIALDRAEMATSNRDITGTVLMEDGHPVPPETNVILKVHHSLNSDKEIPLVVSEDGKLEWSGPLPPARYEIALEDQLFIKSMRVQGATARGSTINVLGSGSLHLDLVLTSITSRVRGKVLSSGKLVAGAMVLLVPEDLQDNLQLVRIDESDSDGTFGLRPAPPGRYRALAIQNGWDIEWAKPGVLAPYLLKSKPVSLPADASTELILETQ